MPGGRPPTPTAILKINGGLRDDRHADRDREPQPEGDAFQVVELGDAAQEAWGHIVPRLIQLGLATELDSHELCAMCEWWAKYRFHMAQGDDYRNHNMAVASYKQFRVIAAKFGLTPTDRVGLQGAKVTQQDELSDLIA
jgi:phage terminase small subunit